MPPSTPVARSLGPLTRKQVLLRALSAVGQGTKYVLGAGGRRPGDSLPGRIHRPDAGNPYPFECDCTGFLAWCYGVDRYVENWLPTYEAGDWFESTALFRDARSPFGFVTEVPWIGAQAGDFLVYPDDREKERQGHVGVVATLGPSGPATAIHCSTSNFASTSDAIRETPVALFARRGAIASRVAWVRD